MRQFHIAAVLLALAAVTALAAVCREDGGTVDGPDYPTTVVDAPIDELDVLTLESFPPQYNVRILSGLPSGCARFHEASVTDRSGDVITIRVTNTTNADPDVACTAIYGTHESFVGLGSDFVSGRTYTVNVNGRSTTFIAQ